MQDLKRCLEELYPARAAQLYELITRAVKKTPPVTQQFEHPLWYKNIHLYTTYPDAFRARHESDFDRLAKELPRIKTLGMNAVHVLPFLESPMVDRGFDISDYLKVRRDLGTLHDVKRLISTAHEQGIRVFMDLVFNHVSDQHTWFKKAETGDKKYREYFLYTDHKPKFVRTFHKDAAFWAEYVIDGEKKAVNIAFPEQSGEIPHWREGKDGYWYYHTYYPEQPDVDWHNPDVFLEFVHILLYWTSCGFHFRLDAIPFVGLSAYKDDSEGHQRTFTIIAALKAIAKAINPECVFIVETYESIEKIIGYFGDANREQAELSYNFHLCTALWTSLVKMDTKYVWNKLYQTSRIPHRSEWLSFLRNHDELSLAYLSDKLTSDISHELLPRGASFRQGHGISGRTYSLLGNDERRFMMAYFLLLSMNSGIMLPYGDEIGKRNVAKKDLQKNERRDTRNINRGHLTRTELDTPKAARISQSLQKLLQKRFEVLNQYVNVNPKKVLLSDPEIFAAEYAFGSSTLLIFINISQKKKVVSWPLEGFQQVAHVNGVRYNNDNVTLNSYSGIWLQK